MSKKLNWGIIGLGNIAHAFVQDLALVNEANLVAVASRTAQKAAAFANQYAASNAYGNYASLLQDEAVDIVYIATPHDSHAALSIAAMEAGKHVLCEKPLAVNVQQVEKMIAVAKKQQVFFMEAFWSRFNPSIEAVIAAVEAGTIGKVNYINADFSFYRNDPDDSRMLNMDLAGGSLLDMGVYPIFLSYLLLGEPKEVMALANKHHTGVDIQSAAIFQYEGAIANMMSGFRSQSDMRARICGTKGSIFLEPIWHETQGYSILNNEDQSIERFDLATLGKGFSYEIKECIACIEAGKTQSDKWSWRDSLALIRVCDEIRQQIDLIYPFE